MPYPKGGPLRHLPPLAECPVNYRTPPDAFNYYWVLSIIERLGDLDSTNSGASMVIASFMNRLCEKGQLNLCMDILQCPDVYQLVKLANHLVDAILKPFQIAGGKSPDALHEASPPMCSGVRWVAEQAIREDRDPTEEERYATLRQQCMVRDNFRCRITGKVDMHTHRDDTGNRDSNEQPAHLDCAHIIPYAFGNKDDTTEVQIRNKKIIWQAMYRYFPKLRSKVGPTSINQYSNVMMLERSTHALFSAGQKALKYDRCFEAGNRYQLREYFAGRPKLGEPFMIPVHAVFPAPQAALLEVHRAVSEILRVTGLSDLILQVTDEMQRAVDSDSHCDDPSRGTQATVLAAMLPAITADCAEDLQWPVDVNNPDESLRIRN